MTVEIIYLYKIFINQFLFPTQFAIEKNTRQIQIKLGYVNSCLNLNGALDKY